MNYPPYQQPRIEFERLNHACYDIFFDRAVKLGQLARRGRTWIFFPEELDGLSVTTMKAIIEKIEWLDTRITNEDRIF